MNRAEITSKAGENARKAMNRTAIGEKKRQRTQWEQRQARVVEDAFRWLHLDWWHNTSAGLEFYYEDGWPDYAIFGDGWHAFMELKASNPETGVRGKLSAGQEKWRDIIVAGGGEWVSFCLPDDMDEFYDWLYEKTGKRMRERNP